MNNQKLLVPFIFLSAVACSNVTFNGLEARESCQVETYSIEELLQIKNSKFDGLNEEEINRFALALLPCVGDPDPEIRDGVVYESLSFLSRNEKLNDMTKNELVTSLVGKLNGPDDQDGYLKPFAALNLSELVRVDRTTPYLTDFQRAELVAATAEYLTKITDYRGYDDKDGWRHNTAHTADLALQFVLNDQVIETQLRALREAIATQIAPESGHAYIHGESERLARPILYMARRGIISQADWDGWFSQVVNPAPFEAWGDVFKSEKGLSKLHNTKSFLNTVYVNASVSQNENIKMLENSALNALQELP